MACASETNAGASHRTAKRARTTSYNNVVEASLDRSANEVNGHEEPKRWSSEEDERLRASVENHQGTNWKGIAKEVQSRTHVQCRQRWKKVLTPGLAKGRWTAVEDELLVSVVNKGDNNCWSTLSARIPGRTSKQCRERWCHHLDPRIVKCRWTAAEDEILVSMQKRIGNKWAQIARHLDGRTENAAKTRWKTLERELKREEDEHRGDKAPLPLLVDHRESSDDTGGLPKPLLSADTKEKHAASGPIGFQGGYVQDSPPSAVGVERAGGSGVKEQDSHDGGRRRWFADEDDRLKEAVEKLGQQNWREVALSVGTRNRIQCRQRWNKALRPGLVKGSWNDEEDDELVTLMGQGFSSWSELAANMRRTAKQCRERWMHHLDPSLRRVSWTPDEDQSLIALEARLGKKWAAIAREIPGRTEHAVKGRFKALSRETGLHSLPASQGRCPGRGSVDRQPATSNGTGGQEAPVPPSLAKQRDIVRLASSAGVGATKTSAPPCIGDGAKGRPAAEGACFTEEATQRQQQHQEDGMEPESEPVALAEVPYLECAPSVDDNINSGRPAVDFSSPPRTQGLPQQTAEQQYFASFRGLPLEDVVCTSSDLTDFLPASLFDGIDADGAFDPLFIYA